MSQQHSVEKTDVLFINNNKGFSGSIDFNTTKIRLQDALKTTSYEHSERVFRDIDATFVTFKALTQLKMETYTHNDGRTQFLLCLYGTIPITYRSTSYNIPIALWIPTEYPKTAPFAFVVPTPNMLVMPSQYIDVSGRCHHPYLQNWGNQNEEPNIVTFCSILQAVFSQTPPVVTKLTTPQHSTHPPPLPKSPNLSPALLQSRNHSYSVPPPVFPFLPQQYNFSPSISGQRTLQPFPLPRSLEPQPSILDAPPVVISQPVPLPKTQNPELINLQIMVYDKVRRKCEEYVEIASPEFHMIMSIGEKLNQNQILIEEERKQLFECETKIKKKTEILKNKISEIDKLIEHVKNMPEISVDDILCGSTIENAIEDAIYYLGRTLNSERIDLNTYMKNIRTLAKEQFMRRALILKIRKQIGLDLV
ncbi:2980_t:CDS:2 [Entrophospora sp. SA101]|nr:906_t:CDS:2 [Entrophospora sp. SA101]CAJ0638914.1 3697_t:CDS:2 [Entrophospora sp. SA101]CAJ0756718.1 2980_t:CDS:2 [Entrophospora sp. SA101]CAJ0826245.1 17064_t:CDS:2 [Entrophospora sp. SA101]CAJ0860275.1 7455_t:CDS:2 [Entrophospora sp. SA101]